MMTPAGQILGGGGVTTPATPAALTPMSSNVGDAWSDERRGRQQRSQSLHIEGLAANLVC